MRVFLTALLLTCFGAMAAAQKPRVIIHGTLKGIMQHDLEEKISMETVPDSEHIYGLGAAAGLHGELLIVDDEKYWSRVQGDSVITVKSDSAGAALLIYTSVPSWTTVNTPEMKSVEDLEKVLAAYQGEEPFAFRLTGTPDSVTWHVIEWDENDTAHTHAKHQAAGIFRTESIHEPVDIIGFYSSRHKGIFTHHTREVHMHILIDGQAAHLDDIEFSRDITLQLPAYLMDK